MSPEAEEAKLVDRTVRMMRMARQVIAKLNQDEDGGTSFQEEPGLSELVIVAQLLGQTSTIDGLREMGIGPSTPTSPPPPPAGEAYNIMPPSPSPDISVTWLNGWVVGMSPTMRQPLVRCATLEELLAAIEERAQLVAIHYSGEIPPDGSPPGAAPA